MSEWAHKRAVLLALGAAKSVSVGIEWKLPEEVAKATPQFMGVAASGRRRQPMGVRRVRAILNELVSDGYVERRPRFYGGHSFRLTRGATVK
jgi:hypothetical protein